MKRQMRQWSLRITEYAERLLKGLEEIDFSESMKDIQRNWIGKSTGAKIRFVVKSEKSKVKDMVVFTTRPDTIFGVDFMVVAPEHEMVKDITSKAQHQEVEKYLKYVESRSEIDRMADALDALGDVAVSESVYQVVQGNYVRASAMVNSLAQGKNIPDPQIVDTPRSGTVITQRVVFNFEPKEIFTQPAGWNAEASPRAKAEPTLNAWLGTIIGNPAKIKCIVEHKTTAPGAVVNSSELSLDELNLQPLDYLFLAANEADFKQNIIQSHEARF